MKYLACVLVCAWAIAGCMSLDERLASNDPRVKSEAERELCEMASRAHGETVPDGLTAVGKLSKEGDFLKVTLGAKDEKVRQAAFEKLKEQTSYVAVVLSANDGKLLSSALGKCDQTSIAAVAMKHTSMRVRENALQLITDAHVREEVERQIAKDKEVARRKASLDAKTQILSSIKLFVLKGEDAKTDSIGKALRDELQKVTFIEDLDEIAKECNNWQNWDCKLFPTSSGLRVRQDASYEGKRQTQYRGEMFHKKYLPDRFAECCKTREEITKFINYGYWNCRPDAECLAKMLSRIQDDELVFSLALSGNDVAISTLSEEMFLKLALNIEKCGSGVLLKRMEALNDDMLSELVMKAKDSYVRRHALERVKDNGALIGKCKDFNFDAEWSNNVARDLLEKVGKENVLSVYKAAPDFYKKGRILIPIPTAEVAEFILSNVEPKRIGWRETWDIISRISDARKQELVAAAKKRGEEASKENFVAEGFFVGMSGFDYAVLMNSKGLIDEKTSRDLHSNLGRDLGRVIVFNQKQAYKLFEMTEGGLPGLRAFVKKYTGTAPTPGQISINYGDWVYKNPKLDVEVTLNQSGGLVISKLGVR